MQSVKSLKILILLSWLAIILAHYFALIAAPTERTMGDIQRIFYFHVPSAWVSFLAFFIVCVASIQYLRRGEPSWDTLARTAAELGILFITLVLLTGPLWAKPVWNTFWTWDARLTTSFILWLTYIAYLMLRGYTLDPERGARFAAVFGIIGFVNVPLVYMSIRWWRTLHPAPVIGEGGGGGLAPGMIFPFIFALFAFTLLFITLLILRYRANTLERCIKEIKSR